MGISDGEIVDNNTYSAITLLKEVLIIL